MLAMKRKPVQIVVVENKLILLCDDGTMWLGHPADAPGIAWQQMRLPPDSAETGPVGFGTGKT
jgi:hypothetical protein